MRGPCTSIQNRSKSGNPPVNVAISDVTFSYVEHEFNNLASAATSVTINRASGKYFAYTAHSARKDGRCKKVE